MADETIIVNKDTDHFFIAINRQGLHSFITLGIHNKNKVTQMLCRVGKALISLPGETDYGRFQWFVDVFRTLFSYVPSIMNDEGIARKDKREEPITYQAYDINYNQYLHFIRVLEGLQTANYQVRCFKPMDAEKGSQVVLTLTTRKAFDSVSTVDSLKEKVSKQYISNTCRHTAKYLVEDVRKVPSSSLVSNHFIYGLPYQTQLDYGKPSPDMPFYVLPLPPSSYTPLGEKKCGVLAKLYNRMEYMLLIDTHSEQTQQKFEKLKELYHQTAGARPDLSLQEVLSTIKTWKEENKTCINTLRKTYVWDFFFTRESATSKMVREIEKDLQEGQKLQ